MKGRTSRGSQIQLSGETDVQLFIVGQYHSLMSVEQKSPALWHWLERRRPREHGLEPRESPQTPCHPHQPTEAEWKLRSLSCPTIEILSCGRSQDGKAASVSHGIMD